MDGALRTDVGAAGETVIGDFFLTVFFAIIDYFFGYVLSVVI